MDRLTPERLQIVEIYLQNLCSVKTVLRALRSVYGVHNRPTERTIRETVNKVRCSFTFFHPRATNASGKMHSLMRFMGRRHHWIVIV